jgi:2,5-dihydroxypyridine 5,6-dioxygenase
MFSQSTFIDLCESELRLCALSPGENLVVLSQGGERSDYVDAFMAAGQRLGASVMNLRLPYSSSASDGDVGVWTVGNTPLKGNRPAVEVLKAADMVVETLFLLFSAELTEIQRAGTRILTCIEPVDLLARLFPTDDVRRRTDVAAELLSSATSLRFTNPAGTDVTYRIGYPVKAQYGFVDKPGGWDHWPSGGMVITGGEDDGVDGRVVVAPGDIILPFKRYVSDPIELTIEAGRITAIDGDGVDADLVRQYMADFADPDAYGLSHIGWGIDERAKWAALATDQRGHGMELRAFAGNVLFSTGPNELFGGPNHTQCHLDIPMRNCSLYLDERPIIVDGEIVVGAMRPGGVPATV